MLVSVPLAAGSIVASNETTDVVNNGSLIDNVKTECRGTYLTDIFSFNEIHTFADGQRNSIWDPHYLESRFYSISEIVNKSDTGQTAWGLTTADFNNDGNIDFAVSHANSPFTRSKISIFYNNGDGTFTRDDVYTFSYTYIKSLAAGDFDNDGDIDLMFTYSEHKGWIYVYGVICILYNDGNNNFGNKTMIVRQGSGVPYDPENRINPHITTADFDRDGDFDFLVGDNSGNVELYRNDGSGNFTSAGVIHDFGTLSWGLATGDFDGDGYVDFLVAASVSESESLGYVYLKKNNGSPDCFDPGAGEIITEIRNPHGTVSLTVCDYNNDGELDFVAGNADRPDLYINKGGAEAFDRYRICVLPPVSFYSESLTSGGLAAADFDNDGNDDLVVGGVQGYVRLFINTRCLAVITRPVHGYLYKNDKPQFQLFPYNGVLSIGPLSVEVAELEEIEKIEFYINDRLVGTDTESPYRYYWTWKPIQLLRFRDTLRIVAYDTQGEHYSTDYIYPIWKIL